MENQLSNEQSDRPALSGDPLSPINHQAVRQFSKSTPEGMQARSETALQALSARKTAHALNTRIVQLTSEVSRLSTSTEANRENLVSLQRDVNQYRDELATAEASLINRVHGIFGWKTRRVEGLEQQIQLYEGFVKHRQEELVRSAEGQQSIGGQIKLLEEGKVSLRSAREIINDFYKVQAQKLEEYRRDQERRDAISQETDLKAIAAKYGVYFIHGITPAFGDVMLREAMLQRNKLLQWDAGWRQRTAIVLGLQPDISVSTLKPGDTTQNMWSKMGLVLSGGNLVNAHTMDASTTVVDIKKQQSPHFKKAFYEMQPEEVKENIRASIEEREPNYYNELVIRDPEIAGFYVCLDLDDPHGMRSMDIAPIQEITAYLAENNIPLYVVHDGTMYEGEYVITGTGQATIHRVSEPISPTEITSRKLTIGQQHQETLRQEAFAALNIA